MVYPNSISLSSQRITADIGAAAISFELPGNGLDAKEPRTDGKPHSQPVFECAKVDFDTSVKLPTFFEIL